MATTNTSSPYQVLPIENGSFETPTLADGVFTVTVGPEAVTVPGWEAYDPNSLITEDGTDVGAWNPPTAPYPNGVPDGENVGDSFVADTPGSGVVGLSQTLDTTLAANTQYTLLVNVGNPTGIDPSTGSDYTGFPGYRLELLAGDQLLDYTLNPVAVPEGQFSTVAFSYTTHSDDPIGENLQVRLINLNENPGYEVDFDNVQVVSQPAGTVTSLPIVNHSFEEPAVADGDFTVTPPPGWNLYDPNGLVPVVTAENTSSIGVFDPTVGDYPNQATDGENVATTFVLATPGSGPVGLSQTLNDVLTGNTHYSLLVDVGNIADSDLNDGSDVTGFPGYRVELLAGNTVVATDNNTLQIAEGGFATAKVDFTAGADNPLLGENLTLRLVNLNEASGIEVDFDNVGLRAEQVQDGSQVYIDNAGFELPPLADGAFISDGYSLGANVPGWELYDPNGLFTGIPLTPGGFDYTDAGAFNPTTSEYATQAPEGQNVGYTFVVDEFGSGVVGLSQTLDTLLAANTKYTLQVEVGNPDGLDSTDTSLAGFPGYEVQLLAGGQVLAVDHNSLCLQEGEFGTATVSFTTGADSSYLGQNLGIRLLNLNAAPGTEVDFDNVLLTANAAPTHSCCGC